MCVNCDTNILNEALEALDTIFQQHGEYNTLFILNDYYEAKFSDAFYHHPSRIELSPISLDAIKALFEDEDMSQWESNTSHSPWCATMMGQPSNALECDCGSPFRRNAEGQ
jgi:hypothetical protein